MLDDPHHKYDEASPRNDPKGFGFEDREATSSNLAVVTINQAKPSGTQIAEAVSMDSIVTEEVAGEKENHPLTNWLRRGLMTVCILSMVFAGLLSSRTNLSDATTSTAAAASVTETPSAVHRYESVPIREIQAGGYRVLADNPKTPGQAVADYGEFDHDTWRVLQLQITKPDGGWLKVSLARPLWWIEQTPTNTDGAIWLEFEELGIANWAEVLSIEECPENLVGEGRLVTGTFQHSAANVIELLFSHSTETITTTANHPFWSEDRQDFVQAGNLAPGEQVRLRDGATSQLLAAVRLDEEIPVYNLEVDGEHVYHVGIDGVLVHNAGEKYTPKEGDPWTQDDKGRWHDYKGRFTDATGWPKNHGFYDGSTPVPLEPETIVSRYGNEFGEFASPDGTPFSDRAMQGLEDEYTEHLYKVQQEIEVLEGVASPAFQQPGGGIQWQFPGRFEDLIRDGFLTPLDP